jgi:hypothetical protein
MAIIRGSEIFPASAHGRVWFARDNRGSNPVRLIKYQGKLHAISAMKKPQPVFRASNS